MTPHIPFLNFKDLNAPYRQELLEAVARVLDSGWYILGSEVQRFEEDFARYCGVPHFVGTGNGLDALTLIIRAYKELGKLHEGDEVLVPSNTYIATILAITENRLIPVLVEPSLGTYNIDDSLLEASITHNTTALLTVHLYGRIAFSSRMQEIAKRYGLVIIEDCAQAHGAIWQGKKAGNLGHAAGFSFYPSKNLGGLGDSGGVAAQDETFADIIRALRNYGSHKKYYNIYKGMNSRMDELQAAVLSVKLSHLDEENRARQRIAAQYCEGIHNNNIVLPEPLMDGSHVWHLYTLRVSSRDRFIAHMHDHHIETLIHYPVPPHLQDAYREWRDRSFPLSEEIHRTIVSIPLSPWLRDDEVTRVIDACNTYKG